jgi:hypothetical protein
MHVTAVTHAGSVAAESMQGEANAAAHRSCSRRCIPAKPTVGVVLDPVASVVEG